MLSKINIFRGYRLTQALVIVLFSLLLSGCFTVTWVSPYDQKLVDGLEEFHKDAATFVVKMENDGSKKDSFQEFKPEYDKLMVKLDTLLVRATANSSHIDDHGMDIQELINEALADATGGDPNQFKDVSLSAAQIIDLRNLIVKWREDHKLQDRSTGVWKVRRAALGRAIVAVMTFELSKKAE
ncbi:hypothetical protein [Curvivirga sp.]|uniref:hypothetical protein n=1 Tax=Curvivirga sp. TaxID=2856848 RepID=UPI003B5A4D2C